MISSSPISQSLRAWMKASTHLSMHRWTRFAKSAGLSMPQVGILMQLNHRGTCGVSEISGQFDITTAAASQLVEKLVQSGYLERTEDASDRRAKQLHLTAKGEKLITQGIEERDCWVDEIVSGFNAADQKKIVEVMEMLTSATQRYTSK